MLTRQDRAERARRERDATPPALPCTLVHPTWASYVAAHPEGERYGNWLGRYLPTPNTPDAPLVRHALFFVAFEDHDRWCTLPGGFFWGQLVEDRRAGSAGWRVQINDGDDWSAERRFPLGADGEKEAHALVAQMGELAPFAHRDFGDVFGLWPDGQEPRARAKRRTP